MTPHSRYVGIVEELLYLVKARQRLLVFWVLVCPTFAADASAWHLLPAVPAFFYGSIRCSMYSQSEGNAER